MLKRSLFRSAVAVASEKHSSANHNAYSAVRAVNLRAHTLRNLSTPALVPRYRGIGALGLISFLGCTSLLFYASTGHPLAQSFSRSRNSSPESRMQERFARFGLVEKLIQGDGNCQMRALADQIYGDERRHVEVRAKIANWLLTNERFAVDKEGTTTIGDFLDRDLYPNWRSYCNAMSKDSVWGDHLTLVAASEAYSVNIWVLSSVDAPTNDERQYVTLISPKKTDLNKTLRLAHYHELHYNSLHPVRRSA